jgi:hypothetical protein
VDDKIFIYCERGSDPSFWAEPLNAVTNVAFVLGGLAAFLLIARQPSGDRRIADVWLAALMCVIGVGSFLFHTFATGWAALADTLPIAVMMLSYLIVALRRFVGLPWWATGVGVAVFLVAAFAARSIPCGGGVCLNGSVGYLPAFLALVAVGGWLILQRKRVGWPILLSAVLFGVSLTFRTLDRAVCADATAGDAVIGLHFMWHLLNATVLYVLVRAAILWRRQ